MATTANTQRSTPPVRGNHPAGRALPGRAPVEEQLAEVLEFRPRPAARRPVHVQPAHVQPLRAAPVPVRLTRRGRRVVAGLVLVGGLGLSAVVAPAVLGDGVAGSGLALAGESSVVVQPGDTLWSIAGELAPDEDPRGVVDALQAANDLRGVDLVPGQVLLVP